MNGTGPVDPAVLCRGLGLAGPDVWTTPSTLQKIKSALTRTTDPVLRGTAPLIAPGPDLGHLVSAIGARCDLIFRYGSDIPTSPE
jgi:hypothetical protein